MLFANVFVGWPLFRYGMSINNDSVMRSVYYKYMHPKEVYIAEGTLVPDLIRKKVILGSYHALSSPAFSHANRFPVTFVLCRMCCPPAAIRSHQVKPQSLMTLKPTN
jgi:hypothetical protein